MTDSTTLSRILMAPLPPSLQTPTATSSAWCPSTTSSGTSRPAARRRGTSGSRPSSSRSCTRFRATSRTRARRARGTPLTPRPSRRSRTRCRATSSASTAMRRVSGASWRGFCCVVIVICCLMMLLLFLSVEYYIFSRDFRLLKVLFFLCRSRMG